MRVVVVWFSCILMLHGEDGGDEIHFKVSKLADNYSQSTCTNSPLSLTLLPHDIKDHRPLPFANDTSTT